MSYAATPSRLSVLLLTDLVGSTDLKTRLGLAEYARRLALHDQLFKQLVEQTPGAEILKDTGDGYFASFATTSDAVRFALRFQHALHEQAWADEPLRARIGIHVGEVAQMELEETGKPKIVGLAADLVSRVTHLAVGGQILLTRFAFNEARQFVSSHPASERVAGGGDFELKWIAHGPYQFKGAEEPIEVFEVGAAGIAPLEAPPDGEDARRAVALGEDDTLGWRPAIGLAVPDRPQWELEKRLGEGGFGEVWLARHSKLGTRRVFKFCFDADRLRSFKRELTLFRLLQDSLGDRPDIARIYEVKLDEPPYFLESEYTEGGNLKDWSDMEGGIDEIPVQTRLDIVARVADAVAAAHSVGVLHKDIKPSNILIAIEHGQPRPRLADFGIGVVDRAKVQGQPVTLSGFTIIGDSDSYSGSMTGTRLYIPPEVLVGSPFTLQGDVYATGVLLYQMVVGDLNRPIAEGWQRDVEDPLVRDDIAACVDGDPTRRLSSAADLAKRLRSLPARREWSIRNEREQRAAERRQRLARAAVGLVGGLLLLLVLVGVFAWREWSLRREAETARAAERRQREIADGVGQFLLGMILSVSPDTAQGRNVTMLEAINAAAEKLERPLEEINPEVEAYVRNAIATAYRTLGEVKLAEPHARKSVEMIEKLKGESDPDTHHFRGELGMILYELGDYEAAVPVFRSAIEGLTRTLGPDHETTLTHLSDLALVLLQLNREDEAEPIIQRLIETRARVHGPDHPDTLDALNTYAGLLYQRGQLVESADKFRTIYESRRKIVGESHPTTIAAAQNYASLLFRLSRVDEAIPIMERAIEGQKHAVGPEHPRTLDAMLNLSQMRKSKQDYDGAASLLRHVVDVRTRKLGPEHPDTLHTAAMLGGIMADAGRAAEAEPLLRQTLELQRKVFPKNDPAIINCTSALALALEKQDRLDEAERMHRDVLAMSIALRGPEHPNHLAHQWLLGRCLVKMNRLAEAEPILLAGYELSQRPAAPVPSMTQRFASQLAILYELTGKPDDARKYAALLPATEPATMPAVPTAGVAVPD